ALIGSLKPCDVFRPGEGLGDLGRITIMKVERNIVRHSIKDQRRAGFDRVSGLEHDRQWLDVNSYRFGSILRLRNCLRDDARNKIAHEKGFYPRARGAARGKPA